MTVAAITDSREECVGTAIVPHGDPASILDPATHALNCVAWFVERLAGHRPVAHPSSKGTIGLRRWFP
jgi:hypothetical protein